MSKRFKIVTSQIESNNENNSEPNTFSYDINGEIVYYDSNSTEHPFMDPGIVYGANYDSSDQSNLNTIKLIPDSNSAFTVDQYLIVEPTGPNHIHIRAGGPIDESGADLYLGGEKNNVIVSDAERAVVINTRPPAVLNTYENLNETTNAQFITNMPVSIEVGDTVSSGGTAYVVSAVSIDTPSTGLVTVTATGLNEFLPGETYTFTHEETWTNFWGFSDTGYLYGPAMGGLFVSGLYNGENDLWLSSNDKVVLNGNNGGEFIGDADNAGNQIAKIAYSREHYTTPETITGAIADIGKLLYANCGDGDMTYLIPDNGDVAFPIGSEIKFATGGDARWFINRENVEGATDLIADGGNGYTGINDAYPYIIPIYSTGTLMKVDTNRWILSGMRLTD